MVGRVPWMPLVAVALAIAATRVRAEPVAPEEVEAAFDAALERLAARDAPVASRRVESTPYRLRAPAPPPRERWRFVIAPYGFLSDVSGDVWQNGEKTSFDVPFEDILDHVNAGFQLYLEARRGRWFLAFDGTIAQLGMDHEGLLVGYDVEIDQLITDVRVGYRFKRWVLSCRPGHMGFKPQRTLDAYVFTGARYFRTEQTIQLSLLGRPLPKQTSTDDSVDPLLGLRVTADLSRRFSIDLRAEAAALGSSGTDRFSWEAAGYLGWHLSHHLTVFLGWRAQGQEDVSGSGPSKTGTSIVTHGPVVGAGFAF